jgi:predicted enzyme related to lactoylglutathione lyase
VEAVDETVDFLGGGVDAEAGAGGGGDAEAVHQRLGAVVAGADGDAVAVEDLRDVVSVDSLQLEFEDTDATLAKLGELGGSVAHGPVDITGVGRFAVVQDPFGAAFAVIAPEEQMQEDGA